MKQALLVAALVAGAGWFMSRMEQGGSDKAARQAVHQVNTNYAPWLPPIPAFAPEPVLFALQAGLGSGLLAYALGRLRSRS